MSQALIVLLYLPKNSTVFTVFGDTILTDKTIKITSITIAQIKTSEPGIITQATKTKNNTIGIINFIFL